MLLGLVPSSLLHVHLLCLGHCLGVDHLSLLLLLVDNLLLLRHSLLLVLLSVFGEQLGRWGRVDHLRYHLEDGEGSILDHRDADKEVEQDALHVFRHTAHTHIEEADSDDLRGKHVMGG